MTSRLQPVPSHLVLATTVAVAGLAGCKSGRSSSAHDAAAQPAEPALTLEQRLERTPATRPPPPPTVKPSGDGDCQVGYAPRPDRDPNPMCLVRGGTFRPTGSDAPVALTDFYIDQFEVTVAQAALFASAMGNSCGSGFAPCVSGDDIYRVLDDYEPDPELARVAAWFSAEGARRYCAWVGKRVASRTEWEYAARFDPRTQALRRYPWGERIEPGQSHCSDESKCPTGAAMPIEGSLPIGTFDGTNGTILSVSPWGLYDVYGTPAEFVAPCDDCDPCAGQAECRLPALGDPTRPGGWLTDARIGTARCVHVL